MSWECLQAAPQGVFIKIWVQPNASKSRVVGFHDGHLKIQLAAPPVDGKANDALTTFFAELFDVPKKRVVLEKGQTSRKKKLLVENVAYESIVRALEATGIIS